MNSFPRLLCLAALATAAFAQTPSTHSSPLIRSARQRDALVQPHAPAKAPAQGADAMPTASAAAIDKPAASFDPERIVLPTATVLRLKLDRAISTASARPGEQFTATLTRPVEVKGARSFPPEPP